MTLSPTGGLIKALDLKDSNICVRLKRAIFLRGVEAKMETLRDATPLKKRQPYECVSKQKQDVVIKKNERCVKRSGQKQNRNKKTTPEKHVGNKNTLKVLFICW